MTALPQVPGGAGWDRSGGAGDGWTTGIVVHEISQAKRKDE